MYEHGAYPTPNLGALTVLRQVEEEATREAPAAEVHEDGVVDRMLSVETLLISESCRGRQAPQKHMKERFVQAGDSRGRDHLCEAGSK